MKKILAILLAVLMITVMGCETQEEINYIDVNAKNVDMSAYDGMSSTDHHFLAVTPTEVLRLIREGGSGIFLISYSACPNCQNSVKYVEEAAANLGVTVYYMDCYDQSDPLLDNLDEFISVLSPILDERDGEKVVLTPEVFQLINGEFGDYLIGAYETADYEGLMQAFVSE